MSGYEDGEPISLSEAVAEALGQLGPGVLSDARAFVGALLDLADADSAELRLLRAGLDDAALAPLAGLFDSEEVLVRGRLEETAAVIARRIALRTGTSLGFAQRAMGQVADGIKAYLDGRGAVWVEPEPPAPVKAEPLAQTEPEPPAQVEWGRPAQEEHVVKERPVEPASEFSSSLRSQGRAFMVAGVALLAIAAFVLGMNIHHWLSREIEFYFDRNGATSQTGPLACGDVRHVNNPDYVSLTMSLPENKFVRAGYTFMGWSQSKDGSDAQKPGTEVSFVYRKTLSELFRSRDVTFYAAWAPIVSFNGNGETGIGTVQPITASVDGTLMLPWCTFKKAGYSFAGWSKEEPGGQLYAEGDVVEVTEPTVYYANWVPAD